MILEQSISITLVVDGLHLERIMPTALLTLLTFCQLPWSGQLDGKSFFYNPVDNTAHKDAHIQGGFNEYLGGWVRPVLAVPAIPSTVL